LENAQWGNLEEMAGCREGRQLSDAEWRNWEVKAQDREEWRSRIKKAKARFGL
jgi:hypothetical protein